jgi:hypothetical protein
LLKLARQFGPGSDKGHRVCLEIHGAEQPIGLRTSNGTQQFLGMVMPMT